MALLAVSHPTRKLKGFVVQLDSYLVDFLLQDSDASIQKRALELVYSLVNESNVKPLTEELIDYLEVSEQDFRGDLSSKICSIVAK